MYEHLLLQCRIRLINCIFNNGRGDRKWDSLSTMDFGRAMNPSLYLFYVAWKERSCFCTSLLSYNPGQNAWDRCWMFKLRFNSLLPHSQWWDAHFTLKRWANVPMTRNNQHHIGGEGEPEQGAKQTTVIT